MMSQGRFLLLTLCVSGTCGVFFDEITDCLITEWSEWSEPYGFGTISRERKVLRYPQNGGIQCPTDLKEERETGKLPTVEQTAQAVQTFFLAGTSSRSKRQSGAQSGQLRDVLIIFDSSGSIGQAFFDDSKAQLAKLIGFLCPLPDPFKGYQRAALIEYSNNVDELFDFDANQDTAGVQAGINRMQYVGGSTCTATAFNYAKNTMFTPGRGMRTDSSIRHEVLILSDGQSNCGGDAVQAANALKAKADVFALIIGEQTIEGRTEMTNYVSLPVDEHLFAVSDYRGLKELVDYIEQNISGIQCAPFDLPSNGK